mgnify:CR=1 FL=1
MFQRGSEDSGRTGGWKREEAMGRIVAGLIAALLCAAPLVMAQRSVVADVPFPFTVRDMKCPAGEWVFTRVEASPDRVMTIRNSTTGESVLVLINLDYWDTGKAEAKLVFHRYGDRYFLREIREGRSVAAYLMAGDEEKRLRVAGVKRDKAAVLARLR